ncbi:hypothetical protein [Geminisphaera colitermitum]|uniref:hypothetical protein n=1 Tax=Geminisphaera colitermitum TaxID=1148786 RepID=UPI0002EE073B|nr:hypothetical protein [Geminisphaera colitermitum]
MICHTITWALLILIINQMEIPNEMAAMNHNIIARILNCFEGEGAGVEDIFDGMGDITILFSTQESHLGQGVARASRPL